jgi:hypothetical protein
MFFGNRKSKAKWQKPFIDNVFRHKTKHCNSFSKIVLSNIELLDGKTDYTPQSLFKFYKPTAENILDIRKRRLWFSHPKTFNDPFDCHTGYDSESYEKHAFMEYVKKNGQANSENSKNSFTLDEYNRLVASTTEHDYYNYNKYERYDTVLRKILEDKSESFNRQIYDVKMREREEVEDKMTLLRNAKIRIACFSALDRNKGFNDIIQMWSHYTDNHQGFCVEYDTSNICSSINLVNKDHDFYSDRSAYMDERVRAALYAGLFPVIYQASRVNIPKTKLKRIKIDSKGHLQHDSEVDAILYKTYIVKSAKWSYEKEWRIILDEDVCDYFDNKVPFPYINRIFLGCKMNKQNIDAMIEIAAEIGAEIVMMSMDNKKFTIEEHSICSYEWERKRSKWNNPFSQM